MRPLQLDGIVRSADMFDEGAAPTNEYGEVDLNGRVKPGDILSLRIVEVLHSEFEIQLSAAPKYLEEEKWEW